MDEIVKQFIAKGYSERSSKSYAKWILELQQYCLKSNPNDISFHEIENFVYHYLPKRKNLKSQSINNAISSFKVYFNQILGLKFDIVNMKRPKRESITSENFDRQEILQLINYFDNEKHKLIVTLLYSCALDISTVILIQLQDINYTKQIITLRNSKDVPFRKTKIGEFELVLLRKYIAKHKPSKYLFESYKNGVRYSLTSIRKIVKNAVLELKIEKSVTTRSFKYSYIQHFTELGYPLKNILIHIGYLKHQNFALYGEITYNPELKIEKSPIDYIANYSYNDKSEEIILKTKTNIEEISFIYDSPFLSKEDVDLAVEMSKLYTLIHCYENSTRKFINHVLTKEIGQNWWEKVASPDMKNRVEQKKNKEIAQKWLSSRGSDNNPLFYLDWSDLLKIFRKKEEIFTPFINDIKFVELRLEELERTRHIIAHNGILPSQDDYDRIELYYKDWVKQIK